MELEQVNSFMRSWRLLECSNHEVTRSWTASVAMTRKILDVWCIMRKELMREARTVQWTQFSEYRDNFWTSARELMWFRWWPPSLFCRLRETSSMWVFRWDWENWCGNRHIHTAYIKTALWFAAVAYICRVWLIFHFRFMFFPLF